MVQLIPVSEWVYDLFEVSFYTNEDGPVVKKIHLASSCENHLESDIDRHCPHNANFYTWVRVQENIGHPRVVGSMHGVSIREDSRSHAQRVLQKM